MSFFGPDNKFYLSFLAVIFALMLMGADNSDQGLRDVINPNTLDDTRSFDKQIIDMFGGQTCGDGLVQQGEQCDPPGYTQRAQNNQGCSSGVKINRCSENCKWKTTCEPLSVCGNGIVEANEGESCDDGPLNECCDDGPLNGTYGHCGSNCQGPFPKYCGNNKLDTKNGNALEACDEVNGVCTGPNGETANNPKPCSIYATSSLNSCASDCQSRGNYCGDGVKQAQEECDDGNNDNEDKCKNDCTINEEEVDTEEGSSKCGNGLVEEDEACDQGDRNGKRCTPSYGNSCTYCSADCQNILTIDTSNFCGDGKLNQFGTTDAGKPLYEVCDLNNNREVIAPMGYQAPNGGWITSEIAFVLDDTGSMGPYINDLKDSVKDFLNRQTSASAGMVTFKDKGETDIDQQFSTDFEQVKNSLSNISAGGGGDSNECVSCGISEGLNQLNWHKRTKKVMIVASLEGAHNCQELTNLANEAKKRDIKIFTVTKDENAGDEGCATELTNDIPNITNGDNFELGQNWNNTLGQISESFSAQTGSVISCSDKGSYECRNECKNLQNNCVDCERYKGKDSIPKIATINPIIAGNENDYYNKSNDRDSTPPDDKWGVHSFDGTTRYGGLVSMYRQREGNYNWMSWTNLAEQDYDGDGSQNYVNPSTYKTFALDGSFAAVNDVSLESDKLCNGEYKFLFNPRLIARSKNVGESNWGVENNVSSANSNCIQGTDCNRGVNRVKDFTDIFNYPVNGESGEIKNSYVASPAVPPQTMRIVVEWDSDVSDKQLFTGVLYSQKLEEKRASYVKALEPDNPRGDLNINMDTKEINSKDYWYPTSSPAFGSDDENTGNEDSIFVHDVGHAEDKSTIIQSMTVTKPDEISMIDDDGNKQELVEGEKVPFYVHPVGSPIQSFQDTDLKVSIYTYKEGQVPLYSIYKPTYQFEIKNSQHSSNPLAKYWHAFNIKKVNCGGQNTWAITDTDGNIISTNTSKHGKVVSRFSEIKSASKTINSSYDCTKINNMDYINNQDSGADYTYSYKPDTWEAVNYGGLQWLADFNSDANSLLFDLNNF